MRRCLRLLSPSLLVVAAACSPDTPDVCGQSGVVPTEEEVLDGFGKAMRDGDEFEQPGSWAAGPSGSIDIGTLSMIIAVDESGTEASDLIARRAFPICVPLGDRSPTSGSASFPNAFVTDEQHGGGVAILAEESGILLGRFGAVLIDNNSGTTTEFVDGVFRVARR